MSILTAENVLLVLGQKNRKFVSFDRKFVSFGFQKTANLLVLGQKNRKFVSFDRKKSSNHAGLKGVYNSVNNLSVQQQTIEPRYRKFVSFKFLVFFCCWKTYLN